MLPQTADKKNCKNKILTDRELRVPDHDRQLHGADKNSINKGQSEREHQNNKERERERATALRALFDLLKSD